MLRGAQLIPRIGINARVGAGQIPHTGRLPFPRLAILPSCVGHKYLRALVGEGVREINLISQDTTYYGMDLWQAKAGPRQPVDSSRGPTLAALLREIQKIEGEFWVRGKNSPSVELLDAPLGARSDLVWRRSMGRLVAMCLFALRVADL